MAENRPVTLQDIADAVKVSRSAVSLALRGSSRVSNEVRRKVSQVAEKLGYRPNPLLRVHMAQLRARKVRRYQGGLAFVSHFSETELLKRRARERFIYAYAKARAEALGYRLDFFFQDRDVLSESRLDGILWSRNIVGVLIGPLSTPVSSIQLNWSRYAAATWSFSQVGAALHRVTHDYYGSMLVIVDELQKLGYKRIGFATHLFEDVRTNHYSIAAFLYYQHLLPKNQRVPYLPTPQENWDDATLMNWYRRFRPDAIISTNPGTLEVLKRNGVRVPEDVGLAVSCLEEEAVETSGIRFNTKAIGSHLVDMVVEQLNNNERGVPAEPKTELVAGLWVAHGTLNERPADQP